MPPEGGRRGTRQRRGGRPRGAGGIQAVGVTCIGSTGAWCAPAVGILSALGSRLSALGSRLSALGSRLSALGSRLSALGSRLSALGSRLSALGSRLSALGSRLSALGSRLSALGSRLSALGSRLSALGSRLSALLNRVEPRPRDSPPSDAITALRSAGPDASRRVRAALARPAPGTAITTSPRRCVRITNLPPSGVITAVTARQNGSPSQAAQRFPPGLRPAAPMCGER